MKRFIETLFFLMFLLLFSLSACSLPDDTEGFENLSTSLVLTSTAEAQQATIQPTQMVTLAPTETVEIEIPSATPTATHTLEPTATDTATPTLGPTPTADCVDKASFVSETVQDGTTFTAGAVFTKTWTLKNNGTCTWNKEYMIKLVEGNAMGSPESQSIQADVEPQSEVSISIRLTAPDKPGTYRGDWKLVNQRGEEFGIGKDGNKPVWVEINVVETAQGLDLGTPNWIDTFNNNKGTFFIGNDGNVDFQIDDGNLVMTGIVPVGDMWRIAERPGLSDFYLEAVFKTGSDCANKDSYGFLFRSPNQAGEFINSGYIFGFSCDGAYRFYRMDSGTFVNIQNWRKSQNILSGPDQVNRIGVLAQGSNIKLYVNGMMVDEFIDTTYKKGLFGLMIRSESTEGFKVFVDQIATWKVP